MTWPATEGHANPFPQSCHSKEPQRWWPPPALCKPLSGGSLNKVCWKVYRLPKNLSGISLHSDLKGKTSPVKNVRGLSRAICDAGSLSFGSAVLFFTRCRHGKWEIRLNFSPDENLRWQVWWHFKGKVTSGHLNVTGNTHYQQGAGAGWTHLNLGYPPF